MICPTNSQDGISPSSRLNGDWTVAEWRHNTDGKGGFQSHFSHHSVNCLSDLSVNGQFKKMKLCPTKIEPGFLTAHTRYVKGGNFKRASSTSKISNLRKNELKSYNRTEINMWCNPGWISDLWCVLFWTKFTTITNKGDPF